jgi:hypothetical protein
MRRRKTPKEHVMLRWVGIVLKATSQRRCLLAVFMLGLVLGPVLGARADEPRYFAIRHARIVPVSGPEIKSGTVVIAKGLIVAVGEDVSIPPEAWVIEGKGLTVYPGFINALSDLGLGPPPVGTARHYNRNASFLKRPGTHTHRAARGAGERL